MIPVKYACNADCSFCITEDEKLRPGFAAIPGAMRVSRATSDVFRTIADMGATELEITGGGEPFLHNDLQKIIDLARVELPSAYFKIYTNGFSLRPLVGVDELNMSRAHWRSELNNTIFRSNAQNEMGEALAFFRQYFGTIRLQTPMMRGLIDSPEALAEMVARFGPQVDQFVVRPLFESVARGKEYYVKFNAVGEKVKIDRTGDYCGSRPLIGADNNLYWDWSYTTKIDVSSAESRACAATKLRQFDKSALSAAYRE